MRRPSWKGAWPAVLPSQIGVSKVETDLMLIDISDQVALLNINVNLKICDYNFIIWDAFTNGGCHFRHGMFFDNHCILLNLCMCIILNSFPVVSMINTTVGYHLLMSRPTSPFTFRYQFVSVVPI